MNISSNPSVIFSHLQDSCMNLNNTINELQERVSNLEDESSGESCLLNYGLIMINILPNSNFINVFNNIIDTRDVGEIEKKIGSKVNKLEERIQTVKENYNSTQTVYKNGMSLKQVFNICNSLWLFNF